MIGDTCENIRVFTRDGSIFESGTIKRLVIQV